MTLAAARTRRLAPPNLGPAFNLFVIGLTAFLTVVDLFATQAILPALTARYGVSAAEMSVAVNASTFGMAVAGVLAAVFSSGINRRHGVMISLFLLAVPTAMLAHAPDLTSFAALRIVQGLLMSTAFTLTLAHLGERCTAAASAGAFAAYVTGNVASNLVGRMISASAVDQLGLHGNFYLFAVLNALGGVLVWATLSNSRPLPGHDSFARSALSTLAAHLANPRLRLGFGIGFCILFAFIGVFTFVNFVLVRPPLAIGMSGVGLVYLVFLPSIVTTPFAGRMVARAGARRALWLGLAVALAGLPLLAVPSLPAVLAGMVLAACGTFFAQAVATGFVSRSAEADRGAASGLYLASYFTGGLVGTAVLGAAFDRAGWGAALLGVAAALLAAMVLAALIPARTATQETP